MGVQACIVNTEGRTEFEKVIDLSEKYKDWFLPCFGVHPVQVSVCQFSLHSVFCFIVYFSMKKLKTIS